MRYQIDAFDVPARHRLGDPPPRRHVICKRFARLDQVVAFVNTLIASPGQRQNFDVELRDRSKPTGDQELIWRLGEPVPTA